MRPSGMGDGSLFVSDQRGIIYRIYNGQIGTFLDIRKNIPDYINALGLGTGLGSFAFHPDFLNNGLMCVTHTEKFAGKNADYEFADSIEVAMQWVVSEMKMGNPKADDFEGNTKE